MAVLPPDPVYILRNLEMGGVNSLCFHNPERLFAGTLNGAVYLWDLSSNHDILKLDTGNDPVLSMHHSDDSLFTQSKGNNFKIWNLTNSGYDLIKEIEEDHIGFCRMRFKKEMNSLIIPKKTNDIGIFNLKTLKYEQILSPPDTDKLGTVMTVNSVDHSQSYILATYESGDFITWDLRANKIINRIKLENEGPLCLDYNIFTNFGIYAGTNDKIGIFNYKLRQMEICKKTDITIKNPGVDSIFVRKDFKVFASGGWDGRIRIFSCKSLRPLAVLTDHKETILDIAYSRERSSLYNSSLMACAGKDGQISLWDIYS